MTSVYISYRRKPSALTAQLIARDLKEKGLEVFLDTNQAEMVVMIPVRLMTAIESADVFICLLGEGTLDSEWVLREIEHAHKLDKPMIPVFQESFQPFPLEKAPTSHVKALLEADGIQIFDLKNVYISAAVESLYRMVSNLAQWKQKGNKPAAQAPTALPLTSVDNLAGRKLGQYDLRDLLGIGGMGAVYRGHQSSLRRDVAIKVIIPALATHVEFMDRFIREAQTAATLEHPHIAPIYDYGIQDGFSYITMRLMIGGSLADRLSASQSLPSLDEVKHVLDALASALDYAHSHGVIHRDIKANNVMFDDQGRAYLVDFGIAKLTNDSTNLTGTGQIIGTPNYMAPEQWRGESITPATDQYALGILVYFMLTGKLPFESPTPYALMHKHLNEIAIPLKVFRPELPEALQKVIEKAIAKQPIDRYPTVGEFAKAFTAAIQSVPVSATGFFTEPLPQRSSKKPAEIFNTPTGFPISLDSPTLYPPIASASNIGSGASEPILVAGLHPNLPLYLVGGLTIVIAILWGLQSQSLQPVILVILVGGSILFVMSGGIAHLSNIQLPQRSQTIKPQEYLHPLPSTESVNPISTPSELMIPPNKIVPPAKVARSMDMLQDGDILGHYQLKQRLDKGERNRVYAAFDQRKEIDVAIKILGMSSSSNREHRLRFQQEAKILGALHHPHIIPFFDYDTEDRISYIVMPLLEGGALRDRLEKEARDFRRSLRVMRQIAGALDYLHSKNVIHRDLKASNILFDDADNPYLVDFGIAKLTTENQVNLTAVGQVVGTPTYMSPEQCIGGMELTSASDQYSLGILAYQMLVGQLPFSAPNTPGLIYKHVYEQPPLPSSLRTTLPEKVDPVLTKALAKRPEDRYGSATQFVEALETVLLTAGTPASAAGHIFISYSRRDQDYARKLADHVRQNRFNAWIDDRIDYGDRWFKEIEKAIKVCAAFVVIMTPDSEESDWVHREILIAKREKKPIFPLLLKGQEFGILIDIQYGDVRNMEMPPTDFYDRLRHELAAH